MQNANFARKLCSSGQEGFFSGWSDTRSSAPTSTYPRRPTASWRLKNSELGHRFASGTPSRRPNWLVHLWGHARQRLEGLLQTLRNLGVTACDDCRQHQASLAGDAIEQKDLHSLQNAGHPGLSQRICRLQRRDEVQPKVLNSILSPEPPYSSERTSCRLASHTQKLGTDVQQTGNKASGGAWLGVTVPSGNAHVQALLVAQVVLMRKEMLWSSA